MAAKLKLDILLDHPDHARLAMEEAQATIPRVAWPTLFWSVLFVGGFAGLYIWGSGFHHLWQKALLGLTLSGYAVFSCFSVSHEALHNNVFRGSSSLRWANEALGWLMGIISLACYPAFKATHYAHHHWVNDPEKDPNYWTLAGGWRRWERVLLAIVYIRRQTMKFAKDYDRPDIVRDYYIHWGIVVALYVGLALATSLWDVVLLWILPALVASWIAAFAVAIIPHGQSPAAPEKQHHVVDILPPGLQELVTVLLNGHNYHMLHHAYPFVPFYKYVTLGHRLQNMIDAVGAKTGAATGERQA